MAFNKISLLSVEDISVSTVNIQYLKEDTTSNDTNRQDIFYHLGTDLGQSTWSNPSNGPYLNISDGIAGDPTLLINRTNSVYQNNTPPATITFEFLTGIEIDFRGFRYRGSNNTSYLIDDIRWEGSNDGTNWESLSTIKDLGDNNTSATTWYYEPMLDNRSDYYTWLRFIIDSPRSGSLIQLMHLEIFGKIRNLTTGIAGFKTPGDRFDNLLNVDVYNPRINREIVYDANAATWESRINQPWTVVNEVMTGALNLTRDDLRNPRFYILSPNGTTRDVFLPAPEVNDAIKFRNLDGLHTINIYEQGNPTPVVLNNAGKVQYEYVYDGIEWHVIG